MPRMTGEYCKYSIAIDISLKTNYHKHYKGQILLNPEKCEVIILHNKPRWTYVHLKEDFFNAKLWDYIEDWRWHNENLLFFFQSKENSLHVFERPLSTEAIWLYFTKFHFRAETFDIYPKDHKFSIWLWIIQSSDEKCRHIPIFHWEQMTIFIKHVHVLSCTKEAQNWT